MVDQIKRKQNNEMNNRELLYGNAMQQRNLNKKIFTEDKSMRNGDDEWDSKQPRKKNRNKTGSTR